jgi:uncharacterized alpha-E superfamily protein
MLGRTAEQLFWLSRNVGRAENMARLAEVGYRNTLMPRDTAEYREIWRSTLASAGCLGGFDARYDETWTENVISFMLLDPDNPSSVYSCLKTARSQARTVRTALTREMWESLNATWLELSGTRRRRKMTADAIPGFLEWVKQQSHLFRGALLGTHLRNDPFHFCQLGAFIERADNTARILDVKYYILLPVHESVGGGVDNYQWVNILRSVSAHRSYRWYYHEDYRPWRIAEFMILCREMPRSLSFCYDIINDSLAELAAFYGTAPACHEIAAATLSELRRRSIDDIFQSGLHEFLSGFIAGNNQLALDISEAYHFYE